ncbi:hypothetical protein PIIN_03953 [Serendipita indica DSM 11827]|uniref:Uncharacterized protein n=1 Tax=Serendipita indica (strain DSM 11827) TaxID=1109443 RepID=G4TFB2_SERID|nr:hypothetical protein PIIN_03953 [Serendipita indica DSM 11827]
MCARGAQGGHLLASDTIALIFAIHEIFMTIEPVPGPDDWPEHKATQPVATSPRTQAGWWTLDMLNYRPCILPRWSHARLLCPISCVNFPLAPRFRKIAFAAYDDVW